MRCSPQLQHATTRLRHRPVVAAAAAPAQQLRSATQVRLRTSSSCRLRVSIYPTFSYDAAGGGGSGSVQQLGGDKLALSFDAAGLRIPALNWRTARVLGVPLPPPLNIAIEPRKLEGVLDVATGQLDLSFDAQFFFTIGSLYKAPPLSVVTTLTSEASSGQLHSARGQRLDSSGRVTLVGVARVPETQGPGAALLNGFLMLPTDALAVMEALLEFA